MPDERLYGVDPAARPRLCFLSVLAVEGAELVCPRRAEEEVPPAGARLGAQLLALIDGMGNQASSTPGEEDCGPGAELRAGPWLPESQRDEVARQLRDEAPDHDDDYAQRSHGAEPPAAALAAAGAGDSDVLGHVLVVAMSSSPSSVDPALRRAGRLDCQVRLLAPTLEERADILAWGLRRAASSSRPDVDGAGEGARLPAPLLAAVQAAATRTVGATAADLVAIAQDAWAASEAVARDDGAAGAAADALPLWERLLASVNVPPLVEAEPAAEGEQQQRQQQAADAAAGAQEAVAWPEPEQLLTAVDRVGSSLLRGVAVERPHVAWSSIGGLSEVKRRMQQAVEWPVQRAHHFRRLGLQPPRGVLLFGPPGCSKTLMVRAAASAASAAFVSLSGADVLSRYVGEAERAVREAFDRARATPPCVLFLDEVDAIVGSRGEVSGGGGGGGAAAGGVLASLLVEMDGVDAADGVLVVAATNRPDALDAALLRPGRFETRLLVPPPDEEARLAILRIHTANVPLSKSGVDLAALAARTAGYTGAELAAVCKEGAMSALRRHAGGLLTRAAEDDAGEVTPDVSGIEVTGDDIERGLDSVRSMYGGRGEEGLEQLEAELAAMERFASGARRSK